MDNIEAVSQIVYSQFDESTMAELNEMLHITHESIAATNDPNERLMMIKYLFEMALSVGYLAAISEEIAPKGVKSGEA